ncbi:50S ribosomal protein L25 [Candidatus Marinamargulisbacteria bacterium SCGC AG-343-D04]|nr:50S ribosomal protein L25 [Candidatus Marinamargulisbacteria bacterium SCGC AG-343-D04]
MEKSILKATEREELRKNKVKKLRAQGLIPCVIYGNNKENTLIYVKSNEYDKSVRSEFLKNTIIKLDIEGKKPHSEFVVTYDLQRNVVSRDITHIDFLRISEDKDVKLKVPVHFNGIAPGTKKGGVLIKKMDYVLVQCLPSKLPATIEIDLTSLEVGEFISVKDIPQEDYTILSHPDNSIVRVAEPRKAVEETSTEESEEEAEGEGEEGATEQAEGSSEEASS